MVDLIVGSVEPSHSSIVAVDGSAGRMGTSGATRLPTDSERLLEVVIPVSVKISGRYCSANSLPDEHTLVQVTRIGINHSRLFCYHDLLDRFHSV